MIKGFSQFQHRTGKQNVHVGEHLFGDEAAHQYRFFPRSPGNLSSQGTHVARTGSCVAVWRRWKGRLAEQCGHHATGRDRARVRALTPRSGSPQTQGSSSLRAATACTTVGERQEVRAQPDHADTVTPEMPWACRARPRANPLHGQVQKSCVRAS